MHISNNLPALTIIVWQAIGTFITIIFCVAFFWWSNKFKKRKILNKIICEIKTLNTMTEKDIKELIQDLFRKERARFWNIIKWVTGCFLLAIIFQAGMLVSAVTANRTSLKYQSKATENLTVTINEYVKSNDKVIDALSIGVVQNKTNIDAIEKYKLNNP